MTRAVRHLVACLLLVLLPFQALAASFVAAQAPVVTCAQMMIDGMDCCDEASAVCPDAGDCAVHAAVAVPAQPVAATNFYASDAPVALIPTLHESHIPDGLQRPPQATA